MSENVKSSIGADEVPHLRLPSFWHFMWMFWMQPILLHRRLLACGIQKPNGDPREVWAGDELHRLVHRQYVLLLGMMAFVVAVFLILSFVALGYFCGLSVNVPRLLSVFVVSALLGLTLHLWNPRTGVVNLAAGWISCTTIAGIFAGLPFEIVAGESRWVWFRARFADDGFIICLAAGLVCGTVTGVVHVIERGDARTVIHCLLLPAMAWLVFPIFVMFSKMASPPTISMNAAVSFLAVQLACEFALPISLLAVIVSWLERAVASFRQRPQRLVAVQWFDGHYIPIPGLHSQLLHMATQSPHLARDALIACKRSPACLRESDTVFAILKAREWTQLIVLEDLAAAAVLRGSWQAGDGESDWRMNRLADAAQCLRAASFSVVARQRLANVLQAQNTLKSFANQLLADHSPETPEFELAVEAAQRLVDQMLLEAMELSKDQLPNAFQAGAPLLPEFDQSTFRGREDVIRQVEVIVADDRNAGTLCVLSPRRSGKSSLLRMLPLKIPDALCVFFDLLDNPIASPLDLFPAMERRMLEQARFEERATLPRLKDRSLIAAADWFAELDRRPGRRRILFCLDEIERLEEVTVENPALTHELGQVMGLLRATIQHRRRVRLLISASAPFEEHAPLWNDTFISAYEIRLRPLARDVAIELLRQPIPVTEGFPADTISLEVAAAIVDRSGGQPYLTQLYGFWLVEELNKHKRRRAELEDLDTVDRIVFEQAAIFFRESLDPRRATFAVKPAIEQIIAGKQPALTPPQFRFLIRRGLLNDTSEKSDGRNLAVPILKRWLNEYAD